MAEIRVKYSSTVPRAAFDDGTRGTLLVLENAHMPFKIERVFVISGVGKGETRGHHAHHTTDLILFIVRGELTMHLDDGESTQSLKMTSGADGLRLGPMLWHSMSDFSPDCVALVVANKSYDESDYIRDYEKFKNYARTV